MNGVLLNMILALVWAAIMGSFAPRTLAAGFLLGFVIIALTGRVSGTPHYGRKVVQVLNLVGFFLIELIKANLRIAYDVITPGLQIRPGVVAIPLDARTDTEITLLANLITLTPGTLSLDVSVDRQVLYIHAMYSDDPDLVRQQIKDGFERRVLEVLR